MQKCKGELHRSMVSGDGHGYREFRCRPFGHRELAAGFRRLKAERLTPERPTSVAVTRHLELIMSTAYVPASGLPLSGLNRFGWRDFEFGHRFSPLSSMQSSTKVGARRCRDRGLRADASPTRPYPTK